MHCPLAPVKLQNAPVGLQRSTALPGSSAWRMPISAASTAISVPTGAAWQDSSWMLGHMQCQNRGQQKILPLWQALAAIA